MKPRTRILMRKRWNTWYYNSKRSRIRKVNPYLVRWQRGMANFEPNILGHASVHCAALLSDKLNEPFALHSISFCLFQPVIVDAILILPYVVHVARRNHYSGYGGELKGWVFAFGAFAVDNYKYIVSASGIDTIGEFGSHSRSNLGTFFASTYQR